MQILLICATEREKEKIEKKETSNVKPIQSSESESAEKKY